MRHDLAYGKIKIPMKITDKLKMHDNDNDKDEDQII